MTLCQERVVFSCFKDKSLFLACDFAVPSKQKYFMPFIKMEKHDRKYRAVEVVGFKFFLLFFSLHNYFVSNMSMKSVAISFVEKADM